MFTVTRKQIDGILSEFGLRGSCIALEELQRYHYEKNDPDSREVRLIVKAERDGGRPLVLRFKNEQDAPTALIEAQSRFAAALAVGGVETPRQYAAGGRYAIRRLFGGYEATVTVEDFAPGQLTVVDAGTAAQTGALLAQMHAVAEAKDLHVQSEVLFHPLKRNDLFCYEDFAAQQNFLAALDPALYREIAEERGRLVEKLLPFADEPSYAVQGDLSDCNLYRTADGRLGVFDFNRCGDNVLYFDAVMQAIFEARLMDYPPELGDAPEAAILPAFLRGYHRARPFTAAQIEAFPFFYALASAFWLVDLRWGENSLLRAVEAGDEEAALGRMRQIRRRLALRPAMPL